MEKASVRIYKYEPLPLRFICEPLGHSVANAYLSPTVLERPNITVAIHTITEKILFEETPNGSRAIGVQLSKSASSPKYRVKARKEVIVCAGAVGTPHLLQVSGLGPKEDLEKAGVHVVNDLPQVGRKYQDVGIKETLHRDQCGLTSSSTLQVAQ